MSFPLEILNGYCKSYAMRFEPETIEFLGRTFVQSIVYFGTFLKGQSIHGHESHS